MQNNYLHIISFDNPFPPNYGGVIDVFFKIKALHQIGCKVYLHCFTNQIPKESAELDAITEKVYFYKSSSNPLLFLSRIPFSVISRNNRALLQNLNAVKAPILFEGMKTTLLVHKKKLEQSYKILRLHNIEQDYFAGIAKSETAPLRKLMFYLESKKYSSFENTIARFEKVITLSDFENAYINQKFNNASYIPVFHGNEYVTQLEGKGEFALYHGDLATPDNKEAVRFLINVFKEIPDYKLVIASGSGQEFVTPLIAANKNIEFVEFSDFNDLKALLQKAHINISWSFQKSGTKLKLINALFNSRFSIINENIVDDKEISDLCILVTEKNQLIAEINRLKQLPFEDFLKRKSVLEHCLNDKNNALLIANSI